MADDLLQPQITVEPPTAIPSPLQPPPPPPPQPPPSTTATTTVATAPKRQRRPSVRLGEIGDQPAATLSSSYESQHFRRPKYRFPKENNSFSKASAVKARSLTNLVNGNTADYSHETLIPDETNHQNGGDASNFDFGGNRRPVKGKRPTKRVRSSWVSSSKAVAVEVEGDSEEEGFRDVDDDPESESPMKENSPVQSLDNGALDVWNGQYRRNFGGDGVRAWLIELGLSRYAPVFEIHEVEDEVLPLLTLEDLKDMGINAVGSRRKMYTAIQKLRKGFS